MTRWLSKLKGEALQSHLKTPHPCKINAISVECNTTGGEKTTNKPLLSLNSAIQGKGSQIVCLKVIVWHSGLYWRRKKKVRQKHSHALNTRPRVQSQHCSHSVEPLHKPDWDDKYDPSIHTYILTEALNTNEKRRVPKEFFSIIFFLWLFSTWKSAWQNTKACQQAK